MAGARRFTQCREAEQTGIWGDQQRLGVRHLGQDRLQDYSHLSVFVVAPATARLGHAFAGAGWS